MDQNPIRLTKLFYRKSLFAEILTNNEEDLIKSLKSLKYLCASFTILGKRYHSQLYKNARRYFQLTSLDLEDATKDSIPLNSLRDTIRQQQKKLRRLLPCSKAYGML
jgi:hypothetical protein